VPLPLRGQRQGEGQAGQALAAQAPQAWLAEELAALVGQLDPELQALQTVLAAGEEIALGEESEGSGGPDGYGSDGDGGESQGSGVAHAEEAAAAAEAGVSEGRPAEAGAGTALAVPPASSSSTSSSSRAGLHWPLHDAMNCPSDDPARVCELLQVVCRPSWHIVALGSSVVVGRIACIAGRSFKATCHLHAGVQCYCVLNATDRHGRCVFDKVQADLIKWLCAGLAVGFEQHADIGRTLRCEKYGMRPRGGRAGVGRGGDL
jgi:hypothetical protein